MRIACLQFAPRVGDVENNLTFADALLAKADQDELDSLDLLVLPELALTGYNFKSLQHISPFLEEAGSGISSLWARTTALKHDCTVVLGYPEKVDVSAKWPASPEYYNSAIMVNGDGDSVGNYRKSFLYYTDETWALEGADGFFKTSMPGLGNVALGVCTDLNPYKLEAPWDAFEFAFHVLEARANLVILTMAWQTHQDPGVFTRTPDEPDIDTLVYWVQRLEPLIRRDKEEEIIVVFCNRTGAEDEATYTGTSAVIGIKRGEVFVYGVLGRAVNDLLIVDTDCPPRSKLTDAEAAGTEAYSGQNHDLDEYTDREQTAIARTDTFLEESQVCQCQLADSGIDIVADSPRKPTSPRLPWLAQSDQPGDTPTDSRSPTRLQIPVRPQFSEYVSMDSAITGDTLIDTPAVPNSAGFTGRPRLKLATPSSPWRFPNRPSPYPWHHHDGSHSSVFGAGATMTPITPFDEDGWSSTPIDPKAPPQWFWKHEPTLSALTESIREEEEEEEEQEPEQEQDEEGERKQKGKDSNTVALVRPAQDVEEDGGLLQRLEIVSRDEPARNPDKEEAEGSEDDAAPETSAPLESDWADLAEVLAGLRARPASSFDLGSSRADRPSSPKSRNLSRNTSRSRTFPGGTGAAVAERAPYGEDPVSDPEQDPSASRARDSVAYRPASRNSWGKEPGGDAYGRNHRDSQFSTSGGGLGLPARPASRTGHHPNQHGSQHHLLQRSNSLDSSSWNHHRRRGSGCRGVGGARPPSRLRHAIFVADDNDNDDNPEREPDDAAEEEEEDNTERQHRRRTLDEYESLPEGGNKPQPGRRSRGSSSRSGSRSPSHGRHRHPSILQQQHHPHQHHQRQQQQQQEEEEEEEEQDSLADSSDWNGTAASGTAAGGGGGGKVGNIAADVRWYRPETREGMLASAGAQGRSLLRGREVRLTM